MKWFASLGGVPPCPCTLTTNTAAPSTAHHMRCTTRRGVSIFVVSHARDAAVTVALDARCWTQLARHDQRDAGRGSDNAERLRNRDVFLGFCFNLKGTEIDSL